MMALDRRKSVMSLAAGLVLAGTVALGGAPQAPSSAAALPASGVEDLWTAAAASGKVGARLQAQPSEAWLPVRRGDTVQPLSSLKTESRSRATMTRGGDIILVDSNTELVLPGPSAAAGDLVQQNSGKALYRVQPGVGRRLEVVTPYLVAGVKGTVFSVVVGRDYVSVSVIEGIVQVRSLDGRRSTDLMAGDSAVSNGPGDRFETFRSGSGEPGAAPAEPSLTAMEAFQETSRLVDSVEVDEPIRMDLDLNLWEAFSEESIIERTLIEKDGLKSLTEDKQDDKTLIDIMRGRLLGN